LQQQHMTDVAAKMSGQRVLYCHEWLPQPSPQSQRQRPASGSSSSSRMICLKRSV
jgi:hypothetical protein